MLDNQTLRITKGDKTIEYKGVICTSKEEASTLLHPDYWNEIPVGMMKICNGGNTKLIRISNNTMLIRNCGSRHFITVES